jgi:AAA domain
MSASSADSSFPALWLDDLPRQSASSTDWLWHGYLASANVTLLTSQWKTGKTTLLSLLLDRMKAGGEVAGLPVKAGKAAIVSEEAPAIWLERSRRHDFAGHVCWLCRPFTAKPSLSQWLALLDQLLALHERFGLALVAIDPLAWMLPQTADARREILSRIPAGLDE